MLYRFAARPARRWLSPLLLGLMLAPPLQATTVVQQPALSDRQTLVKGNGAEPESLDPAQIRSGFPGRWCWWTCSRDWSARMGRAG